jgi:GNAT superfamily N-acetyltransferase
VAEGLKAAGLRQIQAMPVMAVELDKVRTLPGPEGLIIERAETPADIAAFAEAYAPSMGVPHEAVTAMAEREKRRSSAQAEIVRFVARIDGRIVGTAAASISHGVLGVYVVTADPGHRRQGIGTAVTAAALRVGQDRGLLVGTLQASPDGEPVYRRMGFRTVGTYGLFSL